MKAFIIAIALLLSISAKSQEIIQMRIVNTFVNSDKVKNCTAIINSRAGTLTLKSINTPEVFVLQNNGSGEFTIHFYLNGKLEATKTIYRRRDIERTSGVQIYTSRTGEITITLK